MFLAALLAMLALAQPPAPQSSAPTTPTSSPAAAPQVTAPAPASAVPPDAIPAGVTLRIATFNIEDVRTSDLLVSDRPRLKAIAEVIQRLRPTIIFLNEIAYDDPSAFGTDTDASKPSPRPGSNAQRFIDHYLSVPQAPGLAPLRYRAFMAPVNTGMASGMDLDNDGSVTTDFILPKDTTGEPPEPDAAGRKYGGDCWGFGTFPGQYGMALLVDERLTILTDQVRTFRLYPWDYLPGAFLPSTPDNNPWFTDDERAIVRLSSKSHWDVPVRLPNGTVLHLLCSHPTPPAFDGPEMRNRKRNHDEIRLWVEYIEDQPCVVDDAGKTGGLPPDAPFVLLGDLNADPSKGDSYKDPIRRLLMHCKRINTEIVPNADIARPPLTETDTAQFGLRVDYVLPSTDLTPVRSGIWRSTPTLWPTPNPKNGIAFPSDHFPVWMDLTVPPPSQP